MYVLPLKNSHLCHGNNHVNCRNDDYPSDSRSGSHFPLETGGFHFHVGSRDSTQLQTFGAVPICKFAIFWRNKQTSIFSEPNPKVFRGPCCHMDCSIHHRVPQLFGILLTLLEPVVPVPKTIDRTRAPGSSWFLV